MKTRIAAAMLATAFLGLFAATATAQDTLRATVPFAFAVRGETLPAGTYEIRNDHGLLFILGRTSRAAGGARAPPAAGRAPAGTDPVLVFVPSDDGYVLSQVWELGGEGLALTPGGPRHEKVKRSVSNAPVLVPVTTGD
jgi:hypothetical protein